MAASVSDNTETPMSDINTTPLVDVMLVLLIIFLIAVPVVLQSVDLKLPDVHIRGDVNTPYRCIGGAIYTMQMAGFQRVGFISEPPPGVGVVRL